MSNKPRDASLHGIPNPYWSLAEHDALEKRFWRNWTLLVAMIIFTVIGAMTGLLPGLRERVGEIWPWTMTDTALQIALSLIVLGFTIYLTRQQRQVLKLRSQLQASLLEADERMRRNLERLLSLLTVSRALAKETDPVAIFDCITRTCLDTFDCHHASMMVRVPDTDELEVRSATGHENASEIIGTRIRIGEGIAGWVAQHRKPLVLGKTLNGSPTDIDLKREDTLSAAMIVPIVVRDELMGVLNVSSRSADAEYREEDLRALAVFAEHAGVASRHAEQAHWMRGTIQRLDRELQALQETRQRAA